jgi:hypothetical protein
MQIDAARDTAREQIASVQIVASQQVAAAQLAASQTDQRMLRDGSAGRPRFVYGELLQELGRLGHSNPDDAPAALERFPQVSHVGRRMLTTHEPSYPNGLGERRTCARTLAPMRRRVPTDETDGIVLRADEVAPLDGHAALAALVRAHRRCPGSGSVPLDYPQSRTYIAAARCIVCGWWVRVKTDGRLRAHQGRALSLDTPGDVS